MARLFPVQFYCSILGISNSGTTPPRVMKYTIASLLLIALSFLVPPCQAETPGLLDGRIENNQYINEGLGWVMTIPPDWKVNTRDEIARIEGIGQNAIEKSYGEKIPPCHTPLLYLTRNAFNRFTSTAQMFYPKIDGTYRENQDTLFAVVLQTFRDQGLNIRHARSHATLGGIRFETLHITMFTPDGERIILRQIIYDALINNRSLTLSLLYNNDQDKIAMLDAMKQSRFGTAEPSRLQRPPGCIGI